MTVRRRVASLAVGAAVLGVITLGTVALTSGSDDAPPESTPRTTSQPAEPRSAGAIETPDRLVIPSLHVDAPMLPVGTTPGGAQEVPSSLDATGWWREGSKPGEPGNAVIVGHTASKGDGVFDDLGDLDTGDTVEVSSGKKSLTYTVTKEQVLEVSRFATVADEIYRRTGPSGIVLMTCGDWNGKHFETTVIVSAKLVA